MLQRLCGPIDEKPERLAGDRCRYFCSFTRIGRSKYRPGPERLVRSYRLRKRRRMRLDVRSRSVYGSFSRSAYQRFLGEYDHERALLPDSTKYPEDRRQFLLHGQRHTKLIQCRKFRLSAPRYCKISRRFLSCLKDGIWLRLINKTVYYACKTR